MPRDRGAGPFHIFCRFVSGTPIPPRLQVMAPSGRILATNYQRSCRAGSDGVVHVGGSAGRNGFNRERDAVRHALRPISCSSTGSGQSNSAGLSSNHSDCPGAELTTAPGFEAQGSGFWTSSGSGTVADIGAADLFRAWPAAPRSLPPADHLGRGMRLCAEREENNRRTTKGCFSATRGQGFGS